MKILITGGAGYIRSHAARAAQRHRHRVLVYDNRSTGHRFLADGFELLVGDVSDTSAVKRALLNIDVVMHFAAHAYVGESVKNPRKYFENNVQSGLAFLNAALDAGVQSSVFSSSCSVYGIPARIPITEDAVSFTHGDSIHSDRFGNPFLRPFSSEH